MPELNRKMSPLRRDSDKHIYAQYHSESFRGIAHAAICNAQWGKHAQNYTRQGPFMS